MPVIAFSGGEKAVVGKVIEVRRSISRILPVISADMKLGVKLQESRFPGLLTGYSANSNLCMMDYISKSAHRQVRRHGYNLGPGRRFPPGLLVGKVIKSFVTESSAYQRAMVKPVIDFNHVEDVFVIKKVPETELLDLLGGEE